MTDERDARKRSNEHPSRDEAAPVEEGRRAFVALAVVGSCAIAGAVAIPAAMFVAAPLSSGGEGGQGKGKRAVVASLDDLEVGVPKKFSVVGDEVDAFTRAKSRKLGAVWLLRKGPREVLALSVICPHLGCGVELGADAASFACPCHDSTFDLQGKTTAGPSPRAMDALPVDIDDKGAIAVTLQRFRSGISGQEEIG